MAAVIILIFFIPFKIIIKKKAKDYQFRLFSLLLASKRIGESFLSEGERRKKNYKRKGEKKVGKLKNIRERPLEKHE